MSRKLGLLGLVLCSAMLYLQAQSTDSLIQYWEVSIGEVRATSLPEVSEAFIDEALRSTSNPSVRGAIYMAKINLVYDHPDYYKKGLYAADSAAEIFEELGDKKGIAAAYFSRVSIMVEALDYDSTDFYLNKIEQYCREVDSRGGLADVEFKRGTIAYYQSNYAKAQAYYYEALRLYEMIGNNSGMVSCFYELGELLYNCCQNYEEAKKQYEKALEIYPQTIDKPTIFFAQILNRLGSIAQYDVQKDLKKGLDYHYQALDIIE
ncbi:MAG: tetratricopeptide repeat protein [Bacteroidota bacterium]